jgi:hypothetical protein
MAILHFCSGCNLFFRFVAQAKNSIEIGLVKMKICALFLWILGGIFALCQPFGLFAGNETGGFGPKSFSCGQVSGLFRDVWAVQNNPGALGYLSENAVAVSFERRYGSFNLLSFAGAFKNEKLGTFGIGASRFGPDFYNQSRAGLSWGKSFGIASLGVQAQWYQVSAENIASRHYLIVNFGGMAKLGDKVVFSGTISNLSQTKASDYADTRLPTTLKAGLAFQPNSSLLLMTEVQKDLDQKAGIGAGLEYRVNKALLARTGFNTANETASLGLGFIWREFQLDFGSSWHTQLGLSHCLGLHYLPGVKSPDKAAPLK